MALTFDDTYTGPRWTYGLHYRPAGYGSVPPGRIIGADRAHPRYRHGTIAYPRELTEREVAAFELEPVADPEAPASHVASSTEPKGPCIPRVDAKS